MDEPPPPGPRKSLHFVHIIDVLQYMNMFKSKNYYKIMDGLNVHYITVFENLQNYSLVWMYKDKMDGLSITNHCALVATPGMEV